MGDPRADGYETVTIESQGSALQATFVPAAGMVCCSLRHRGVELLAPRAGVRAYAQRGSTMGIPLLYPWANRLASLRYPGPHGEVELAADSPLLKLDANGLPIHGAIPGALPWELLDTPGDGGRLRARLEWRRAELLALFPFEHTVQLDARIEGEETLAIETSVHAQAPVPVPVSFGYHPYLAPPGERAEWLLELPVSRWLRLDERMIPTGESEPFDRRRFALADGDWDASFAGLLDPPVFSVTADADATRVTVELREGYSHAQLYAPAGESFVCFEPMTAPTNALISRDGLTLVAPGASFRAAFAISVQAP